MKGVSGIKLQIIDNSEAFCNTVAQLLQDAFEIDIYADGWNAASRICSFRPDILVLSATLQGNDGFRVLQTVQTTGVRPMVLMLTPLVSDYIVEVATQLKVCHMICKPCDTHAVADCVFRFGETLAGDKNPTQTCIRSFLLGLNFRTNLCGYRYLTDAFSSLLQNPGQSLTKELYPAIAKQHNGSWQQIERGIRLSIADAWRNREGEGWKLCFPNQKDRPSNSSFLSCGIGCLQEIVDREE